MKSLDISKTIEENYMPYAMSVIVSRAIPEIDGFKPAHRKLLYTMYKMGLIDGVRTKSANVIGQTMRLNPHSDMSIYETMVRLTRGNEALLFPYIDSKGNFGKVSSRDITFAASRYTEVKLEKICKEIFLDIEKDSVRFVDNYDATMKEPVLLPTTYPNILINPNIGIAVGMSCNIPSFNLEEICNFTIAKLKQEKKEKIAVKDYIKGPDFSTGASVIYDENEFEKIFNTGVGNFRLKANYRFDKKNSIIEIYEIPYTTTIEAIIDKVISIIKLGKIKEIIDIRDETGLDGLKIAIEVKKNTDIEKFMYKLYKLTPLESTFSCNLNVLIDSNPMILGINDIIDYWIDFRIQCIKNKLNYELKILKDKLHLIKALNKIFLDIDKCIDIIKNTDKDEKISENLIIFFKIDEKQAEFISNIKLRNLNKEYLLNKIKEENALKNSIDLNEKLLNSNELIKKEIIKDLNRIKKEYKIDRKTKIINIDNETHIEESVLDYPTKIFFTKEGYLKKISFNSYKMASIQKLKDNDEIIFQFDSNNTDELLLFTNKANVYKIMQDDIKDVKASEIGYYINNLIDLEDDENIIYIISTTDFKGFIIFGYENGRVAKIPLDLYKTKTKRKKLINSFSTKSKCISIIYALDDIDVFMRKINKKNNQKTGILFNTNILSIKTQRSSVGEKCMSLEKEAKCDLLITKNVNLLYDLKEGKQYKENQKNDEVKNQEHLQNQYILKKNILKNNLSFDNLEKVTNNLKDISIKTYENIIQNSKKMKIINILSEEDIEKARDVLSKDKVLVKDFEKIKIENYRIFSIPDKGEKI